jgi:arabinofuranosyltransferase
MSMRQRYPILVLAAALVMAASRAWTCDDAFITFRVVSQFLAGQGPVFNIGERVQVFTHPLWLMALTLWSAMGASLFPGAMWLSVAIFGCGLAFLYLAFRDKPLALAVAGAAMIFSQSLMDFATGGLETPLSFALFAAALHALRAGRSGAALAALALLPLNRLDLLPWVLPFAWLAAPATARARAAALAAVCAPAAVWIAFSTVYYGAPLPNTAVAKLGLHLADRLDQGLAYVLGSFAHDPGALALLVLGVAFALRAPPGERRFVRAAALSAAFGLAYPVWSGGDFMLGRFILPALWALLAMMLAGFPQASAPGAPRAGRRAAAMALAATAAFLLVTGHSTTNLWLRMKNESLMRSVGFAGATDERRVYIPWLGAYAPERLVVKREVGPPASAAPRAVGMLGQSAYLGRSDQAMIDIWALADPFLGRFAPLPNGRPGHPFRPLPADFPNWRDASHRFDDATQDALARDLRLAHLDRDLWSAARFKAIARLALHPTIAQDAVRVADEGSSLRIEVKPLRLFRPWPDARSHVVWLRLHDAGRLRYGVPLDTSLDADCRPFTVARDRGELTGLDVPAGETLTLRCPKATLGREGILMRIGVRQVIGGRDHVEYDEAVEVLRPPFFWASGLGEWLLQGWTERPRPAVTAAIVLLLIAGLLWRASRYTFSPARPD